MTWEKIIEALDKAEEPDPETIGLNDPASERFCSNCLVFPDEKEEAAHGISSIPNTGAVPARV